MPIYEYKCEKCGKKFDIIASIKEKEIGLNLVCPNCKGKKVHQIFSKVTVITSSKTETGDLTRDLDKIPNENLGAGEDPVLGDEYSDAGGSEDIE